MKKTLLSIAMFLVVFSPMSKADTVENPTKVILARQTLATLAIPRWKAFMSPANPNELWLSFANWGPSSTHLVYSTNAGTDWTSANALIPDILSCDYHLSAAGDDSANLFFTVPNVNTLTFRKINYPAQSSSDMDPIHNILTISGSYPRGNIMIEQGNQRIWVFSRASSIPSENVRYHYSDNGGINWTSGIADPTHAEEVRIGSMPYVGGRPALVVAYMSNSPPQGYKYYLWDGSQFQEEADAVIYDGPLGLARAYTHNVTSGTVMHLVFGLGTNLYHYWKPYNNGSGLWNSSIVDSSPYNTGSMDWEVNSSVRGSELFIFYSKNTTSAPTSSEIYYAKWTETDQTWSSPEIVSTHPENTDNHHPNTVMSVPVTSDYIPVFWYSHLSASNEQIYFNKILVDSTAITVKRLDIDKKIKEFKEGTTSDQEVLDLIETYNNQNPE